MASHWIAQLLLLLYFNSFYCISYFGVHSVMCTHLNNKTLFIFTESFYYIYDWYKLAIYCILHTIGTTLGIAIPYSNKCGNVARIFKSSGIRLARSWSLMISVKNRIFKNSYLNAVNAWHVSIVFFSYSKIHNMTHEQKFIILQNVSIFSSCEHHVAKNIKRFQSNFSCFDFSLEQSMRTNIYQ